MGRRGQQAAEGGRGRGSGRGRREGGRAQAAPPLEPAVAALREAETVQQRAERRKGAEAIQLYRQSAELFQRALELGLPDASEALEASFGLGDSLQSWAEALREAAAAAPDEQQSAQQEAAAAAEALGLLQRAVAAYSQVVDGDGQLRVDAALNSANALTAAADLTPDPPAAEAALRQALAAYEVARRKEEDALTLGNMADAYVKLGEAACKAGAGGAGQEAFQAAEGAYEAACSLCDSASGDDLPGLLYDWGAALFTMAGYAQDASVAGALLSRAATKLRDSAAFGRGDPQPLNALGDVLVGLAERHAAGGDAAGAGAALEAAAGEGYGAALRLSRANADALVGCAEVLVLQGRAAAQAGDAEGARRLAAEGAKHYGWALQHPTQLGTFSERCDVRYNYGCALAAAGQEDTAAEVFAALLRARGPAVAQDLREDADLAEFRGREWFQRLAAVGV
eukprot:jgi/Tetstr1/425289/TSEL_015740.t1